MRRDNRAYRSPVGWLKNGNPPGDPNNAPRCGARREKAKSVWLPRCATAAAECMEERVRARELRKVWRDLDVHVGNTVCTPRRQRPSTATFTNCCRILEDCSHGSLIPLGKFPCCMGFIARFLWPTPSPSSQPGLGTERPKILRNRRSSKPLASLPSSGRPT